MDGSRKRKEALLNECKGNLYEFLVARQIAQDFGLEADFIRLPWAGLPAHALSTRGLYKRILSRFAP